MSPARTAARRYPVSWRRRYGDEPETLILDMSGGGRVPWRIRANVAAAGGRERLRAAGPGGVSPDARVRGGASLVLWAWTLFVVAGAIVQRTSEHWDSALPGAAGLASGAFDVLIGSAVVTSFLVLAGIGLTLEAMGRLLRAGGWPQIRRTVLRAGLLTVVTVAATIALVAWGHGLTPADRGHDATYVVAFLTWSCFAAATLGAWTAAATRTAARLTLGARILRLETRLATAAAAAMAIMAGATAVWWVSVATTSPRALTGSLSGHGSPFVLRLVFAMGLMAAAVALGGAGGRRATRAVPHLAGDD